MKPRGDLCCSLIKNKWNIEQCMRFSKKKTTTKEVVGEYRLECLLLEIPCALEKKKPLWGG